MFGMSGGLGKAAVGLGAVAFVTLVRTPREERMLLPHGEAWRAYVAPTGRFVPRSRLTPTGSRR
jgi:protein-S-isoprenylcysteine O-methyltransferase Ste14